VGSNSFEVNLEPVTWVRGVLKRSDVYVDRSDVEMVYQVRDAVGRSQVSAVDLQVKLSVLVYNSSSSYTSLCTLPSSTTGIGSCSVSLPTSVFSASSVVDGVCWVTALTISSGQVLAVSDRSELVLHRVPTYPALTSLGATITLSVPLHPLWSSETFSVTVTASTAGNELTAWLLNVTYNPGLLSYTGYLTSSIYTEAVAVSGQGYVSLSSSGLAQGVGDAQGIGSSVSLATLSFTVLSSVTAGSYAGVMRVYAVDMVNVNSLSFLSKSPGTVHDIRGGAQTSATLVVSPRNISGILAYSPRSELVHTAAFTGSSETTSIVVYAVDNVAGSTMMEVTSTAICVSGYEAVFSVKSGGC